MSPTFRVHTDTQVFGAATALEIELIARTDYRHFPQRRLLDIYRRFGQPIGTNIKTQGTTEAGTDMVSRNVGNYQSTPSDVPGDRRSDFHRDGSLKSRRSNLLR